MIYFTIDYDLFDKSSTMCHQGQRELTGIVNNERPHKYKMFFKLIYSKILNKTCNLM